MCPLFLTLYQYAQTMISELMPRGYDNMFFALFGITNRAVGRMSLVLYFLQVH